jgi:hypothetical protein
MEYYELEAPMERVRRMESYLEKILQALENDVEQLWEEAFQERFKALSEYYSGGLWLEDYDRDCAGEFPADFKRGVLGQDTLYDLFEELSQAGIIV